MLSDKYYNSEESRIPASKVVNDAIDFVFNGVYQSLDDFSCIDGDGLVCEIDNGVIIVREQCEGYDCNPTCAPARNMDPTAITEAVRAEAD